MNGLIKTIKRCIKKMRRNNDQEWKILIEKMNREILNEEKSLLK